MTSASDKARFYLEQIVPELKEWERKNIFTREEISSITKKRSDFEHRVNARGPSPSDYARYTEFEINVDTLRKRRVKRLGIRSVNHTGQRRIFNIFERATKRFPGDIGLWMQYIEYTRRQRALKKLSQILTSVLRLHPQKADLWIYAARFALEENADMREARSYMQRGLRFCKSSRNLWLEYTKLELLYISKITTRRQILGVGQESPTEDHEQSGDLDADMINLPRLTGEDVNPSQAAGTDVDESALQKFEQSPVLSGAIPLTIFDAAMKQFAHDASVAKSFFELIVDFPGIKCQTKLLNHTVDDMLEHNPQAWQTVISHVQVAIAGLRADEPDFPKAFGTALSRLRSYIGERKISSAASKELEQWLVSLSEDEGLDPALAKVINSATALVITSTGDESG